MVVGAATLGYTRHVGGKGDRPNVENRWWAELGKDARGVPIERPPAQFGHRFFKTGDGFEQERARLRLTDSNVKWLEEATPGPDGWGTVQVLPGERFAPKRLDRVKQRFRIPPGGRGVVIDSGNAVRLIMADAAGIRLVEVRLGEESSFDAWVHGEWVREALFRDFEDALRRCPGLVREYLQTARATPLA
jgi:hypothetical protein